MSAVPQTIAPAAQAMRVLIVGRIVSSKGLDKGGRMTVIVTPAPDAYSHPSTVEVKSQQQLGAKGDDVRVACMLKGYMRRFEFTDKRTGEVKQGERADHTLEAVE
jgi:hypothetical protein